ncbi:MAG: hypothetical protein JWR22_1358 [Herminiimonas sp.]|nr:hypothetical protein [Herminiimonas sp.]
MIFNEEAAFRRRTSGPTGYKVAPTSRIKLRAVSNQLRQINDIAACYTAGSYFDVGRLLEDVLFRAGYCFHPVEDHVLNETAAFAVPQAGLIVIQNDIYDRVYEGDPFARYTVVHEFGHIVLDHSVTLHRGAQLGNHGWHEDSEWQANNLAAEIMMPLDTVKALGCDPSKIADACGVSMMAAQYRVENLRKDKAI